MNKPTVMMLGIGTMVIAAGAMWFFSGPKVDKQVAALEAMGSKLFTDRESMSDEERRAAFGELRQAYEQLTPEQRSELRDRRRQEFQRREDQRLRQFFAMSKEEQVKELDARIDEMERWRKERERRRQAGQTGQRGERGDGERRGGPGGFAGGPGDAGGAGGFTGGGGRGGDAGRGDGGRGGGRGDWASRSGAGLNERRQERLNQTTASERARRTEYGRMLRERRQQRGLG